MIGLDTNIVVRYLVQDDPIQSKKANHCIEKLMKAGEILWICHITLCEIFWVLDRAYKLNKEELISVLSSLLQTKQIEIEDEDIAWDALRDYEKNSEIGFADCLIGRKNARKKCNFTYTFDKDAAKNLSSMFKLLS